MLICITGKIGCGKSTILKQYKRLGYKTLEMDKYIHSIYKSNKIGYKLIKEKFGQKYVNDKEVNRKKLGQLVFKSKKQLDKLNAITLPLIKNKILSFKKLKGIIFIELGIYTKHAKYFSNCFDLIILVKGKQDQINKKINKLSWNGTTLLVNWKNKLPKKTKLIIFDNTIPLKQQCSVVKKTINLIKKYI